MPPTHKISRLAVDIGGTFTDLAIEHAGRLFTAKLLTTPAAPEQGVLEGAGAMLRQAGLHPAELGVVVHGTTLATNAIIERKGARTALVTTEGFRDVLAMGTESRYDQYDLNITLPEPLVPRHLRFTVPERLDNEGHVLRALDERSLRALAGQLRQERVESVAIGFLHSFVDARHERAARAILEDALPRLAISLSSEVSPEMREWERFSTTVANAYVQPLMASYLRRLEAGLRGLGVTAPLFLMLSGGGLTTIDTACAFPVRLVESGPAAGAIFAADIARRLALDTVLSFDMGGTTAKICLIDAGQPQTARSFEVARVGRFKKGSGLPLRIPVIEMVEIGAGGGSVARLDTMGRIAVGPESAGADPGPACYGRGGRQPAVTDANLALGRYDSDRFAGGTMRLDEGAARQALSQHVGDALGLSPEMAALGVVEIVDEAMASAARIHAVESGKANEGRTLIAFGGGGPVHACRMAEKLGITRVLIPVGAGVGSAVGLLRAPIAYEVVRSLYQRFATFDLDAVNHLFAGMEEEARGVVEQGSFGAPLQQQRLAYMRYVGQGHEIPVPLPARALVHDDIAAIRAAYDREYARFYDRPVPGSDVEILSYAVQVSTAPAAGPEPTPPAASGFAEADSRTQPIRDPATGEVSPWRVHERSTVAPDARVPGPAVITEDQTSTLVGPGWVATIDRFGYIALSREA